MTCCRILAPVLVSICVANAALSADLHNDGVFILDDDTALADLVVDDVGVFSGEVCIGVSCTSGETFSTSTALKLSYSRPNLEFNDTSNPSFPDRNWRLRINDTNAGGMDRFSIEDLDAGTIPFSVRGNAPDNALFVDSSGQIGVGTMVPLQAIHIGGFSSPGIRFEDTVGFAQSWNLAGNDTGFVLQDVTFSRVPFRMDAGAPESAIDVDASGRVGLGTSADGKLHTLGNGVQLIYFESGDGDAVQVRFRTDSQNRRFLAVNNANEVQTQMQFRDDAVLFLGQTVAQEWLRVDATGITTAGPSCGSPCDAVFDPDAFTVPSIEQRAALMWQQRYLPAIGPTGPHQPMNMTEKIGGIIHELEVAHIYIEQLHTALAAEQARNDAQAARIETQARQIARLAAQVEAQAGEPQSLRE